MAQRNPATYCNRQYQIPIEALNSDIYDFFGCFQQHHHPPTHPPAPLSANTPSACTTSTYLPTYADSPASALTVALESEVLAQELGAHGGFILGILVFSLRGRSAAKIWQAISIQRRVRRAAAAAAIASRRPRRPLRLRRRQY